MPDSSLFHGIAVIIDDEIEDAGTGILELKKQIEASGSHVVSMTKLPDAACMANLREVSFFVDLCGAPHKSINVETSVMWSRCLDIPVKTGLHRSPTSH